MLFKDHFKKQFTDKIKNCNDCKLSDKAGPIYGYGNLNADVMFIADAPHVTDIPWKIPFTGKARKIMLQVIEATGLKKGEYYMTSMIKHIPDKISDLNNTNIRACAKHLYEEIELVNPRIIVSMGFYVGENLFKKYNAENLTFSIREYRNVGRVMPAKKKRTKVIWPKRYFIFTWNPNTDNPIKQSQIISDVGIVQAVKDMGALLF